MTIVQVIEQVKDTLKEPSSWTQGAAGKKDDVCAPLGKATCFCILGALWKNTSELSDKSSDGYRAEELMYKLAKEIGFHSVPDFNDSPTTTHKGVIAFLDLAIEQAKELP